MAGAEKSGLAVLEGRKGEVLVPFDVIIGADGLWS